MPELPGAPTRSASPRKPRTGSGALPIGLAAAALLVAASKLVRPKPPPLAPEIEPGKERPVDKIIVAIHGIGSQSRSSTIRTVASRFGDLATPPLPPMPLGFFNLGDQTEVRISYLDPQDENDPLRRIGFAEIFWADIPKAVVKEDDLLEETKAWGRTVVGRAQSAYMQMLKDKADRGQPPPDLKFQPEDFDLGVAAIDEIVETIGVLENLLFIAGKAGLVKFDLAPLLRDYIGDVQLVADFPFQRDKILFRFHSALGKIVEAFAEHNRKHRGVPRPEIYIVAHSEGTVISFLGMLEAFMGKAATDPEKKDKRVYESRKWIADVRGYMTIGSPIDKHILLWPGLWTEFKGKLKTVRKAGSIQFAGDTAPGVVLSQKIKWRNYYDYGDPIGFQLNTAVEFLCDRQCGAFEFVTKDHDIGFSRYVLPGAAHNSYWTDKGVFGHFIDTVVSPPTTRAPMGVPKNKPFRGVLSTTIPYVLTLLIHFGAVFALYQGLTKINADLKLASAPMTLSLLSALLFCMTVAARIPRLVKGNALRWRSIALAFFAAGALCICWLPDATVRYLAFPYTRALSPSAQTTELKVMLAVISFVVSSSGWWIGRKPNWGRWTLLGLGTFSVSCIVIANLVSDSKVPTWPMVLAGAAFLYLWWLGILLFDLTFVWHRYIRNSVAIDIVRQWRRGTNPKPRSVATLWRRPNPEKEKTP